LEKRGRGPGSRVDFRIPDAGAEEARLHRKIPYDLNRHGRSVDGTMPWLAFGIPACRAEPAWFPRKIAYGLDETSRPYTGLFCREGT